MGAGAGEEKERDVRAGFLCLERVQSSSTFWSDFEGVFEGGPYNRCWAVAVPAGSRG